MAYFCHLHVNYRDESIKSKFPRTKNMGSDIVWGMSPPPSPPDPFQNTRLASLALSSPPISPSQREGASLCVHTTGYLWTFLQSVPIDQSRQVPGSSKKMKKSADERERMRIAQYRYV